MSKKESERRLAESLERLVDRKIEKIDSITSEKEEIEEIPERAWLTDRLVEKWEFYILGNMMAHVTQFVATIEESDPELEVGDLDSTELRRAAKELVESKRDELVEALRVPEQPGPPRQLE